MQLRVQYPSDSEAPEVSQYRDTLDLSATTAALEGRHAPCSMDSVRVGKDPPPRRS
jgi:hypothetical protein